MLSVYFVLFIAFFTMLAVLERRERAMAKRLAAAERLLALELPVGDPYRARVLPVLRMPQATFAKTAVYCHDCRFQGFRLPNLQVDPVCKAQPVSGEHLPIGMKSTNLNHDCKHWSGIMPVRGSLRP